MFRGIRDGIMFGAFYLGSGYYGVGPIGILHIAFSNPDTDGIYVPNNSGGGELTGVDMPINGIYKPVASDTATFEQQTTEETGMFIPNNIKNGRY